MEGLTINIDWPYFLGILGFLIATAWYSGSKFSKIETLVSETDKRLTTLEGRLNGTLASQSPINLTSVGEKFLKESGMKKFIDENIDVLFSKCKSLQNLETAYDVQVAALACLDEIKFKEKVEKKFEQYIFEQGIDIKNLRRIGGLYLRNVLFEKLDMKQEDLD